MAVCGGVSCIFEPRLFVALSKAKMISPEGTSRPFSNTADGYGRGEGCGVVLLKPLKKVRKFTTLSLVKFVAFLEIVSHFLFCKFVLTRRSKAKPIKH